MKTQITALLIICFLSFRSFSQTNTHTIILVDRSVSFPSPPTSLLSTVIAKYFTQRKDIFQAGAFHGSSYINDGINMDYKSVDPNLGKSKRKRQELDCKNQCIRFQQMALDQANSALTAKIANPKYTMIAQAIADATHKFATSPSGYRKILIIPSDLEQTSPKGSPFRNLKANPPLNEEQAKTMANQDAIALRKEINKAGVVNLNVLLWTPASVGQSRHLTPYRTYWETLLRQVGVSAVYSDGGVFEREVTSFQPNFMEE